MADVVLPRSDDFVFGVVQKLVPMSEPPNNSRNHEEDRKHVSWEPHGLIDYSAVEVNIGVELPIDEVFIAQGYLFELDSDFD